MDEPKRLPCRRTVRLRGFPYGSANSYFITICTQNRRCVLSEVINSDLILKPYGLLVMEQWKRMLMKRPLVVEEAFVIMPNHIHALVTLEPPDPELATQALPLPHEFQKLRPETVSTVIGGFKSGCTKAYNERSSRARVKLFQRGFYDHVVRSEEELAAIKHYIEQNPAQWQVDRENPNRKADEAEDRSWRTLGIRWN